MTAGIRASVLVLGYGNPGRLDDGLGPAFAERIQALAIPGVTADSNYQLAVEDAAAVAQHDVVLFADASIDCKEPFELSILEATDDGLGYSSHSLSASAVLGLAKKLFGVAPQAHLLAIRGYEYNAFGEGLSEQAEANLKSALAHVEPMLRTQAQAVNGAHCGQSLTRT